MKTALFAVLAAIVTLSALTGCAGTQRPLQSQRFESRGDDARAFHGDRARF